MSEHRWDFVSPWQILVGQCPMTDCYLQPCTVGIFRCLDVSFTVFMIWLQYFSDSVHLPEMKTSLKSQTSHFNTVKPC